jgi:hypothetical protein
MLRALVTISWACALAACGGSPSGPSEQTPHEIVLSGFTVDTFFNFEGLGPYYAACGGISPAPGVAHEIQLQDMTVQVRDAAGRAFLTWPSPSFASRLSPNSSIGGCFSSYSDPIEGRAAGATFLVRVTYSAASSGPRVIETSGPIASRRPPLP